ncbi:Hypothetical predicted protein [Podarcis lilfordi]|uniref:Uncharacterized protein n=1 Tax=Podarcis lilfordi TaxID=74358 RepID=A0AA35L622_9SAUR|nr:Hypothetical predicted protein [Podarcis lilfordi]
MGSVPFCMRSRKEALQLLKKLGHVSREWSASPAPNLMGKGSTKPSPDFGPELGCYIRTKGELQDRR